MYNTSNKIYCSYGLSKMCVPRGIWFKPTAKYCKRCGANYSLLERKCEVCINLSDEQAETKRLKIINEKVKFNKNITILFTLSALFLTIFVLMMWSV